MLHSLLEAEKISLIALWGLWEWKAWLPIFPIVYKLIMLHFGADTPPVVTHRTSPRVGINVNVYSLFAAAHTTRPCTLLFSGVGYFEWGRTYLVKWFKVLVCRPTQLALLLLWTQQLTLHYQLFFVPTGKVELHGKVIEVDYSVPKKLR